MKKVFVYISLTISPHSVRMQEKRGQNKSEYGHFLRSDWVQDRRPASCNLAHIRSSHEGCSMEKAVLKSFAKFAGKHLCWSIFSTKFHAFNVIKERLLHRCFPVKLAKFLRTPFSKNSFEWLLPTHQLLRKPI